MRRERGSVVGALSGQVALVTGAGSGIGKAIALDLAGQGASMWLAGRTQSKLEATASVIPNASSQVLAMDLASDASIDAAIARVADVDILVLAGGEYATGPVATAPVESLDALYRANLRGNYRLTQALLPRLQRRPGQIVFINSSTGLSARPDVAMFSATNHALKAFADALRAEINPSGVRVLTVHPGRTATPRLEGLYASTGQAYKPELLLQPEDVALVVRNALTMPKTAEITDISLRPLMKSY